MKLKKGDLVEYLVSGSGYKPRREYGNVMKVYGDWVSLRVINFFGEEIKKVISRSKIHSISKTKTGGKLCTKSTTKISEN